MEKTFALLFLLFTGAMIVLYGIGTEYRPPVDTAENIDVLLRYPFFQDVHVMIFIGFGFLMSFLNRAGFTATSHAFLVAAFSVLWAVLNRGFWFRALARDRVWDRIHLTVVEFVGADFAAGAVLISFGALLGRVTASQLLLMAILEIIIYSINEAILVQRFEVADIGGSMIIHTFGAFFGLACSLLLEKTNSKRYSFVNFAGSTRVTDTMAMVGTLFLFCFWPSFNAALTGHAAQDRAIVNTLLSILTSTVVTFFVCCLVDGAGKFGMVEIQNSTLAGGVAIGAAADMVMNPFGAMCVGLFAGTVSVLGYRFITPRLENAGLRDTCGVLNLHGLPGFIGGIVSAIAAGAVRDGSYLGTYGDTYIDPAREHDVQAGMQMASLGVTVGLALLGGAITGLIIARLPSLPAFFEDIFEYTVPDEVHGGDGGTLPAGQTADAAVLAAMKHGPAVTPRNTTGAPSASEHGAKEVAANEPVTQA
jgi:ammonium transporter Rh